MAGAGKQYRFQVRNWYSMFYSCSMAILVLIGDLRFVVSLLSPWMAVSVHDYEVLHVVA